MTQDPKRVFFDSLVKTFSPLAYVNSAGNDLGLEPESQSSDSQGQFGIKDSFTSKKKSKKGQPIQPPRKVQEVDFKQVMAADQNKIDLLNFLTHTKVIAIKKAFSQFPMNKVDLDQFVNLMREILKQSQLIQRQNLQSDLMDLYYRVNHRNQRSITFQDFTSYLIEHQIDVMSGGQTNNQFYQVNMQQTASHNNYIDKIYYFYQIDKIFIFEQNMKIYDAKSLKYIKDYQLPNVIIALQYIHQKGVIVISLSDRTLLFHEVNTFKLLRKLVLPYSQRCLCYVRRKRCLFSGSLSGIIFAWDLDKLFNNEQYQKFQKQKDKSLDYSFFLTQGTPWFDNQTIMCIIDLPNLNLLATTSLNKNILLWDLRVSYLAAADQKKQKLIEIMNQTLDGGGMMTGINTTTGIQSSKKFAIVKGGSSKSMLREEAKKNKMKAMIAEEEVKRPYKILKGHQKAVRDLAYAEKQKILVSCGFDFEVIVWNPLIEKPNLSLKGHENPLVSVNCPHINPCIVTCDNKGVVKVWDFNDFSCSQTFNISNVKNVTCLRVVPQHRRIIAACKNIFCSHHQCVFQLARSLKVYEYSKPFSPELSDDFPILCAKYSSSRLEFFICGGKHRLLISFCYIEKTIKIWNARVGRPIRVLPNIVESDITALQLDGSHRKLLIGDHNGEIKMFDVMSGVKLHDFSQHQREISFIKYSQKDKVAISGSWDQSIKFHGDSSNKKLESRNGVLRQIRKAHHKDIMCGDFNYYLNLLATGSRDQKVKLWNYQTCKLEAQLTSHKAQVTLVYFIHPFPLLISSDGCKFAYVCLFEIYSLAGTLNIWSVPPFQEPFRCVVTWKNMFTLQKTCPVTSVSSFYLSETKTLKVVIGDEMGMVRVLDMTQIISTLKIKPLKQPINEDKRNPYRIIDLDGSDKERDAYDGMSELQALQENTTPPMLQDLFVQQQAFWKGHNDAIKNIDFILETDKPFIFTTGLDRMAKIWNLKGEIQGIFTQGIMTKVQSKQVTRVQISSIEPWTFPLQRYNSQFMKRQIAIKTVLQAVQKKRALEQEKQKLMGREQQKRQTKMSFGAAQDPEQDFNVMEIDDQIGEVLRNEEVFKDLKELEEILQKNPIFDQDQDMYSTSSPQTASSGNRY